MSTLETILLLVFVGIIVLDYLKVRRYVVFYLVKTRHGLTLIDWMAFMFPRFWGYCADAAVVVSFGGVGGAYLAKYGRQGSLYATLFVVGLVGIVFYHPGWYVGLMLALLLAFVLNILRMFGSVLVGFASTTVVAYLLLSQVFTTVYVTALTSVLGAPALLLTGLTKHAIEIVLGESTLPGVSPLLPGSREGVGGVRFPGYNIFVPWWFALIALIVTLVSHEGAHGILARVHKIRVKSTGIITAGFLPIGAFVEPDDDEIKKRGSLVRMRVFAAGSFANFVVAAVAGALILGLGYLASSVIVPDGMEVVGVVEGYPAFEILRPGDVITEVNGRSTPDLDEFRVVMDSVKPGDPIAVSTDRGDFSVETRAFPSQEDKAYIGIEMLPHHDFTHSFVEKYGMLLPAAFFLMGSLYWIAFFNINIALVNLLPLFPFDGWRMLRELLGSFRVGGGLGGRVTEEAVMVGVLVFTLILFAVNMYPLLGLAAQ